MYCVLYIFLLFLVMADSSHSGWLMVPISHLVNPTALRKAKIVCNFGLSECSRVKAGATKIQHTNELIRKLHQCIAHMIEKVEQRPDEVLSHSYR